MVLGHVVEGGGVLVAPGLAAVDGDALAAALEEHLDHAFAGADVDLAADVALRRGVVVALEADVTVRPDLALDPLSPLPGVSRQRGQGGPLVRLEERAAALAALGHGGIVEAVELAADGSVHGVEGEEGLVAQCQQDARLDGLDAALDQPLVGGPPLARRQHCHLVMERELPVGGIEPDVVAVGIVHA